MNFTIEDIKDAFRSGRNSTDRFAEQKGFARNEVEYAKRLVNNLDIPVVVVPKGTLCECNGNERVALDCTMKSCKHPKYFKG